MRKTLLIAVLLLTLLDLPASWAKPVDLTGYQYPDGAIAVQYQGDFVDPYFAVKGLLLAHRAGFDIQVPGRAWVGWLMPRQHPDGRFERYCRSEEVNWRSCAAADADDALLALWLELLHVLAPPEGLPPAWRESAQKAEAQLALLRDPRSGVYRISTRTPVSLFMDNVEIYEALRTVGREQARRGLREARASARQAETLRRGILSVFRSPGGEFFRVSTQAEEATRFYPEMVAQIYPWLHGLHTGNPDSRSGYRRWLDAYGAIWLGMEHDPFPWGLVAITALLMNDPATALEWRERAEPLRHSGRWNILEEVAYQQIGLGERPQPEKIPNE